ncbi:tether containing UBX domain for GLUT4 isoform X2 [Hippocampus zosterae]|uniref:tether containing UBX domain for GLUT4 isoform X2 n=1 Tax=Hippocampus zosterae TaxID=109293 RepID=UPI00223E3F33|nr:tether containing UBX domain for GLUT4 isoform X2 [Hippocampus zosterae]
MAASGASVTVLTPNGRRQTVKVSPNTPLLQVLEEVCKKHGFNPDTHGLKFQRTVLDLTQQWRFANLPNNAKLEVVPSTRTQTVSDSQVRIALQMEDGSRLQGSFSCEKSLWELLTHFPQIRVSELSESGSTPVCVYMRDEVCGEEALKKATLKSLGLMGGSAIVRFLLKRDNVPEDCMDTTKVVIVPAPPVVTESQSSACQLDPIPSHSETSMSQETAKNSSPAQLIETVPVRTPVSSTRTLPVQQEKINDTNQPKAPLEVRQMLEDCGEEAGPSGVNSHSSSSSSSSTSDPAVPFIPFSGGGQRLGGPNGSAFGHVLSSPLSSSSLSASAVESPKAKKAKPSHSSAPKHQATAKKSDRIMDGAERFLAPVEREPLIYHIDHVCHRSEDDAELPDEFFEVTVDDIRKRFAQLKSERKSLEEAPLMTRSLREKQMKEKIDKYPKVVLRIQFPDRHVLQGFFRPLETVGALTDFVRSHLEDPLLSFYLFITPPKKNLDDPAVTLFQADLFPGALVYLGSDVKTELYLKRELLETSVSALQANESIASCMFPSAKHSPSSLDTQELPPPPEPTADTGASMQDDEKQQSTNTQAAKPSRSDVGKVPKWLKLPGNK